MLVCWYHYKRDNDYVAMWKRACLEKGMFGKERGCLEKSMLAQ